MQILIIFGLIVVFLIFGLFYFLFSSKLDGKIELFLLKEKRKAEVINLENLKKNNSNQPFDLIIRNGKVFDGTGLTIEQDLDIGIRNGVVDVVEKKIEGSARQEIDAKGFWVCPGFLDVHVHYDVEIEKFPGLEESVRHGVTTVLMGNCSLSAAVTHSEEELLDLFCRVENMPRDIVYNWIAGKVDWRDVKGYYQHLEALPLGPNVATLLGHSNLRAYVMGLDRSLREDATPNEIEEMKKILLDALRVGYFGLSIDMLPFHRMLGSQYGGLSIPSQRAPIQEYVQLTQILRKEGGLLQATPNIFRPYTAALLFFLSAPRNARSLKTTILAALDTKSNRLTASVASLFTRLCNVVFGGDVRFQALAVPFVVYSDGANTPLFEEFGAGYQLMNLDEESRKRKCANPEFRQRFRSNWYAWGPRLFNRNMADMWMEKCPAHPEYCGKNFVEIAKMVNEKDPVDLFLDLVVECGDKFRWKTLVANDRPEKVRKILTDEANIVGFNDSGAHTQNMAFHCGHLQVLKEALLNENWISYKKAVSLITGKPAAWLQMPDVGLLLPGKPADIVILDPDQLKNSSDLTGNPFFVERGGGQMLVQRTDGIIRHVLIGGKIAFWYDSASKQGRVSAELGQKKFGRLLRRVQTQAP